MLYIKGIKNINKSSLAHIVTVNVHVLLDISIYLLQEIVVHMILKYTKAWKQKGFGGGEEICAVLYGTTQARLGVPSG